MYMLVDFDFSAFKNKTLAVALSGGSDSMALLNYLYNAKDVYSFNLKAINVEHGIRGEQSFSDTAFVKDYCEKHNIPLLSFSVDSIAYSKENKLSLEESARILRYSCFEKAIENGDCDVIATAHHLKDNAESVLFNLFRGAGLNGLTGIKDRENIVRPFISLTKDEINEYIKENDIPFVTDETNFDESYTRNYIRKNILPAIEKAFPNYEKSLYRLSITAREDEEYFIEKAKENIKIDGDKVKISLPLEKAIFSRAVILTLKSLGVKKDWEKKHIDDAFALSKNQTGKSIDLLFGIKAVKEYDHLTFYKTSEFTAFEIPFSLTSFNHGKKSYTLSVCDKNIADLKSGLYFDFDKVPASAVIRTKKDGDTFKAVNGKTKNLSDFLCEKKIPLTKRENLLVIAVESVVYAVLGVAIAEQIKIDETTKNVAKITKE